MSKELTEEQVVADTRLRTLDELLSETKRWRKARHRRIIQDLERVVYSSEWFREQPRRVQDLYKTYPPWGFYTYKPTVGGRRDNIPVRHYGVVEYADGSLGFRVCSAHSGWTNVVVGGAPEGHLERIEWWTDEQIEVIKRNNIPRAFLEPMGFMVFQPD